MEQRHGRFLGHAPVTVGGAGRDALEQARDRAKAILPIEARDEMDLGRARIGEADLDAGVDQRPNDAVGTVHRPRLLVDLVTHVRFLPQALRTYHT